jgi:hypothetical protein
MPLISQHRNLRYVVWAGRDAADDARVDAVSDEHAIDDEPAPDDLRSAPAAASGTVPYRCLPSLSGSSSVADPGSGAFFYPWIRDG